MDPSGGMASAFCAPMATLGWSPTVTVLTRSWLASRTGPSPVQTWVTCGPTASWVMSVGVLGEVDPVAGGGQHGAVDGDGRAGRYRKRARRKAGGLPVDADPGQGAAGDADELVGGGVFERGAQGERGVGVVGGAAGH